MKYLLIFSMIVLVALSGCLFDNDDGGSSNGTDNNNGDQRPAPRNLEVSLYNANQILLNWEAPPISNIQDAEDLEGYVIYRNYEIVREVSTHSTSYIDMSQPIGSYTYYVRAKYSGGLSGTTNYENISITGLMYSPYNLEYTISNGRVNLSWQRPTNFLGVTGYRIYRNDQLICTINNDQTMVFTDGVNDVTEYSCTYYVTCIYSGVESEPSNTVTVDFVNITFNNNVFTDIEIMVNSTKKTVHAGGSVDFLVLPNNGVIHYTAKTSGETSSGVQIGLMLEWNYNVQTYGNSSVTRDLIASSDYFFIKFKNEGTHDLTPLYVNAGNSDQTIDNIVLYNNHIEYRVGYYRAYSSTVVRAYFADDADEYVYWDNLGLPFTDNQYVILHNGTKGVQTGTSQMKFKYKPGTMITRDSCN